MSKFLGPTIKKITTLSKSTDLGINSGILNGLVRPGLVEDSAVLNFINRNGIGKVRYTLNITDSYESALSVRIFWSPADDSSGYVTWKIRYKNIDFNEIMDGFDNVYSFSQYSPMVKDKIIDTADSLKIFGITPGLLLLNVERNAPEDTYNNIAQVHKISIE